jgi:septin family protein
MAATPRKSRLEARLQERTHKFNILVVGKSGTGKSALQRTLFGRAIQTAVSPNEGASEVAISNSLSSLSSGAVTNTFTQTPALIQDLGGESVAVTLFDSEGYGEAAHLETK